MKHSIQFWDLWLNNGTIAEIWETSIKPLFQPSPSPEFTAQGKHNFIAIPDQDKIQIPTIKSKEHAIKNGFTFIKYKPQEKVELFGWQDENIWSIILGVPLMLDDSTLLTIKLFLWKVVNDLKKMDLEVETIHDEITSVYNQNHLRRLIDHELDRGKRYGLFFSLLFLDLDNLKAVNDIHGHLVGTEVLKEVSELIKTSVRRGDAVARFGGDEFVILLLHAHPQEALIVAQRTLNMLSDKIFLEKKNLSIKISASIGIAGYPEHGDTTDMLIQNADIAMYRVKQAGKNGIAIF